MEPITKDRQAEGPMKMDYCPYCMAQVEPDKPCPSCGLTVGSYKSQPKHLPAGTVLRERYLVGRVLGEGGFGITYIGRDLVLGLKVAIKEYFPTDRASRNCAVSVSVESFLGSQSAIFEKGKQRFLGEARTMARLDRLPNIVGVRDFFEENATAYIVMEYIDGTTLSALVGQRGGTMPAWELLHLIEPLFDSLSAMHELGLIHRDISPDNLMLEHGIIKLLDFGCAREAADGDATMTIMLRHGYAPLEQYQSSSGAQGAWTDVYALAATIYFCVTGKKPPQSMDRIFQDDLIPPRKLGAELTASQEEALLKALKVQPKARFQSVKEFHTALYEGVVTVRFDTGAGEPTEVSVARGDKLKLADMPVPEREGYVFTGWFLDEACKKPVRDVEVVGECTFYAGWQEEKPPKKQEKDVPAKVPFWRTRLFQIGAAAVAAIAILGGVLGIVLSGGRDRPAPSEPVSSGQKEPNDTHATTTPEANKTLGAVTAHDMDELLSFMADENEYSVINYIGRELYIEEPVEITKPLIVYGVTSLIGLNASMTVRAPVTLQQDLNLSHGIVTVCGEGANLTLHGCHDSGLVRTRQGGKLTCSGEGTFHPDILWLADYSDLVAVGGASMTQDTTYIVFDEDNSFENAVHVTDSQMLRSAAANNSVESIVIDANLRLTGGDLPVNKPLLIAEGATVTGDGSTLCIQNALVNNGTITGSAGLRVEEGAVFVNNGLLDPDEPVGVGPNNYFVNNGRCDPAGLDITGNAFVANLGEMTFGRNGAWQMNLFCSKLVNFGTFRQTGATIRVDGRGNFENRGTVELGGEYCNLGFFRNNGSMTVSGNFNNHGGFLDVAGYTLRTAGSGVIADGIVLTNTATRDQWDALQKNEGVRMVEQRWSEQRSLSITSAERLAFWAASSADPSGLIVEGDITVEGDLTVERDITIAPGCHLAVTGTLTLKGGILEIQGFLSTRELRVTEGGALCIGPVSDPDAPSLELNGGGLVLSGGAHCTVYAQVDLNGGAITVSDHSAMFDSNVIKNCSGLTLTGDSTAYILIDIEMLNASAVKVLKGSLVEYAELRTDDSVTVDETSVLMVTGECRLEQGGKLTNWGITSIEAVSIAIDTAVDNQGFMDIDGMNYNDCHIHGSITNRGELWLAGTVQLESGANLTNYDLLRFNWGQFTNYGKVVNRGTAKQDDDSFIFLNPGVWEGNGIQ